MMWNRAIFDAIRVHDGNVDGLTYEEAFGSFSDRTRDRVWTQGDSNP